MEDENLLRRRGGGSGVSNAEENASHQSFRTTTETGVGARSEFVPEQFIARPTPIPYKSIVLGFFLFTCGVLSLLVLVSDLWLYLTTKESDVIGRMRRAVGLFGETLNEEETDEEARKY